ncbi:TPA: hypothetical protein HA278_02025 [Candidatus Woesearchaeota archaeon]|nr:hypothetical protein [archaeon]HIJ10813.1 hypothetical protein [Candidatus Woesearchaeota archaeon]
MIIGYKDPAEFRSKQVAIYRDREVYNLAPDAGEMDFGAMSALRSPADLQAVQQGIRTGGFTFANVGVSAALTLDHDGSDYAVLVRQDRPDFGDSVAKLVSGYTPASTMLAPHFAVWNELAEEVVPHDGWTVIRFRRNGVPLPTPFDDLYDGHAQSINIDITKINFVPDLCGPVGMVGSDLIDNPSLYFHLPTNSAQLVYGYHLDLRDVDLARERISLWHSEEKFNSEKGMLDVHLHEEGLYLVRLENGDLTDNVFTMTRGVLEQVDPRTITLSEAFAPKEDGIVSVNNISLDDYLRREFSQLLP